MALLLYGLPLFKTTDTSFRLSKSAELFTVSKHLYICLAHLSRHGSKNPEETLRKLELIMDTYDRLMGDTAQELLDTAGCRTDSYPWPDSCRQIMDTLLETLSPKDADVSF